MTSNTPDKQLYTTPAPALAASNNTGASHHHQVYVEDWIVSILQSALDSRKWYVFPNLRKVYNHSILSILPMYCVN